MKNKLQNMKEQVKALRNKKGFTLIELIVVIAVLGILVLLAAPKFLGYTQDANVTTLKADAKVLENASLVYHVEQEVDGNPGAWPVGTGKVLASEVTLGTDLNGDGDATDVNIEVYAFDKSLLGNKVKTLKNDLKYYGLTAQGTAIYIGATEADTTIAAEAGVKDSDGNIHFGTALEIPKTVTP